MLIKKIDWSSNITIPNFQIKWDVKKQNNISYIRMNKIKEYIING